MIHENAGWVGGQFSAHLFHRFLFSLPGGIGTQARPGKNVEAAIALEVTLKSGKHFCFMRQFANTSFAEGKTM